jgi:DNA-binding transcriptional LysR family regulator
MEPSAVGFPTPHQLEIAVAIARYRSFAAAARALTLSQPSLTAQVRAAERALGVEIFRRTRTGVEVTEAGRLVIGFAEQQSAQRNELVARLAGLNDGVGGRVRIGAGAYAAESHLPAILSAYRRAYPGVEVEITIGNGASTLALLRRHEIDIAFTGIPSNTTGLQVVELLVDRLMLFVAANADLSRRIADVNDIADLTLVTREKGCYVNDQGVVSLNAHGFVPAKTMELSTNAAVMRMVQIGMGIGLLSETAFRPSRDRDRVRRVQLRGWRCRPRHGILRLADVKNPAADRMWDVAMRGR